MAALSARFIKNLEKKTDLEATIEEKIPGFEIKSKDESNLMKLLSFLLFFNKSFMKDYVTTFYPKVYVPGAWKKQKFGKDRLDVKMTVLAHEYVHLSDRKKMGWLFNILYLSPQIFALLAVGAFWDLRFLTALLFLLPLPSPGRAWLEYRGYCMSIAAHYWLTGSKYNIDYVVKQFTTGAYYWMFPFKSFLKKKFSVRFGEIVNEVNLTSEMKDVKNILLDK
tara:strand:- start:438 stop:1103 length:666 start_codon:yes stop_codon:yes gene_type:complete